MKALVVFGSVSDSNVYLPIVEKLKEKKASYDLRICSAHRTPEMVPGLLLKKEYDFVIAGAGLAAHLPGVMAANTVAPVIGVPCNGCFDGLDSFLAIVQMPPGVPVLSVGVGTNPVSDFLFKKYDSVKVTGDMKNKAVNKCIQTLEEFDVEMDGKTPILINFFDLKKEKPKGGCINVPLCEKATSKDALTFFEKSKKGYFVGINRGENAAVFAVSMLDRLSLIDYREAMEKKVMKDDEEVRRKK